MATIKTMHEAFLHELSDAYDAERQLIKALPKLVKQAQHPMVKQGIERHLSETEHQAKNIERVVEILGSSMEKVSCKGMAGIISENEAMLKEIKTPELIDGAIVGGGQKIEHYEIATYRGLVAKAELMGHSEALKLLQINLAMEEHFSLQLENLEEQLGNEVVRNSPQVIGHAIVLGHTIMGDQAILGGQAAGDGNADQLSPN